jgi:hypothetical protein
MSYKANRQEKEYGVRMLAEQYPKCFFEDPERRRPLKKNIIADLQKNNVTMASELITASVEWYESHIGYQYCLQAGRKRIDLNGNEVGTVTEQEQLAAKKKIDEIHTKLNAYPPPTLPAFVTQPPTLPQVVTQPSTLMKAKVDAPPMEKSNLVIRPELTRLYEAVLAANTVMCSTADNDDMFTAITTAAINVILREAQSVITNISRDGK